MSKTIPTRRTLFADLREAIVGSRQDFTEGSLGRAIFLLSIPMVLEMMMQSVFEVADIYFVGQLGADAVAAVGLTSSLLILVFALGMGLSMAATATVARRIGEKDPEAAATAAFQALVLGFGISVPIGIIGVVFAPEMLAMMGASPEVIEIGTTYCAIIFGTNITILFLFLINAIFRGTGDAQYAMRALWIANLLNIALDPLLIFGIGPFPEMGIMGAAVATSIGRAVGVCYQIYILFRGKNARIRLTMAHFKIDTEVMRNMLRISGPGMLQYIVGTASWIALMRIIAMFGAGAVAGYTIAIRVIIFALLPSWGMGNAAATLVGQNLGAGKPDRAEKAVWITSFVNMVFLGLFALVMFFFAEPIIRLFTDEAEAIRIGANCLRIVSYSYIFFAYGMVTVQAFNGAGDTKSPTWINFISYWLLQLPLAYALAVSLNWGTDGVFAAIAIAQTVLAVLGIVWFRQGKWKTQMV